MDMGLNEQQIQFQDSLQRYLRESLPVDTLRRFVDSGGAFDEPLWRGLVGLGLAGLLVPEEFGGSGLGMLDAVVAAEMLGGAAAPVPFPGSVAMAAQALRHSGSRMQQESWLPRVASGEARIAVAFVMALSGQTGQGSVRLEGARLSGRIDGVLEAMAATHLLIYLANGHAALTQVNGRGVALERHRRLDATRATANIVLDGAEVQMLDAASEPMVAAKRVLDTGRLMLAADTLGAAQTMLDRSVAFAKERMQFGRPIGSFQGVKYMCADMVTQLEPCRALLWDAALVQGEFSSEARVLALQAKAHVSDVSREVSRMAIEVHGGMGFTELLGLPYWFKRIAFNRQMLGNAERCRLEAAQVQGWAARAA